MFRLDTRKALITGATSGIGESIARHFHAQGATVTLTGRNLEKLESLVQELGDNRAFAVAVDMNQTQELDDLVQKAATHMGGLDTLVNNAGVTKDGLMLRMKDADYDEVMTVDLKAPFVLMRSSLKHMMKAKMGRIINITSVVGVTGNPGQTNYAAAKAGLIGMSKSVALEMAGRLITVNCIAPGYIATPMTGVLNDAQQEALLGMIPLKSIGSPQDIAAAAVYLASDAGSYVTGQTLHVNGGMAMI